MKRLKDKEYEEYQQYIYYKMHGYINTPDLLELICRMNENDPERIGRQILEMTGRLRNEHVSHRTNDKHRQFVIRALRRGETELLKDFLYEAIFVPEGTEPPYRDILEKPELRVYTDDFGARKGDNCLVADFGARSSARSGRGSWMITVMWMMKRRPLRFRYIRSIAVRASAHS